MIKKTITYTNFNDEEVTEDYYFHLSKAELFEMGADGDYEAKINAMIKAEDAQGLVYEFRRIILQSVGVKSEDGKNFLKTPEYRASFEGSEAFSEIFMSVATDAKFAEEFMNGIVPNNLNSKPAARKTPAARRPATKK